MPTSSSLWRYGAAAALTALLAGHLQIRGTRFIDSTGAPFRWRGITAFRLVEMVAGGREREAVAFLDWAAQNRITIVRVLAMATHLFQLRPDEGTAALPRLLELAAARKIAVEIVALADTAAAPVDLESQVRAVGAVAGRHANALVEIANEPAHPTQDRRLHDPAFVEKLARLVPDAVPVALGSAEENAAYARGEYATYHFPRHSSHDGWGHVLALVEGAAFVTAWGKPVVSDEPIGAAAQFVAGRRDNQPGRFRAAAALTRLTGMDATFHYEGGLQARVPSGRELDCFRAWRAGVDMMDGLPEGGRFVQGRDLDPIARASGARAAFARVFAGEAWLLLVDARPESSARWAEPWRQAARQHAGGLTLLRARR